MDGTGFGKRLERVYTSVGHAPIFEAPCCFFFLSSRGVQCNFYSATSPREQELSAWCYRGEVNESLGDLEIYTAVLSHHLHSYLKVQTCRYSTSGDRLVRNWK